MLEKRQYLYKSIRRCAVDAGMELIAYKCGRSANLTASHALNELLITRRLGNRERFEHIERETGFLFNPIAVHLHDFLVVPSPKSEALQKFNVELNALYFALENFEWGVEKSLIQARQAVFRLL